MFGASIIGARSSSAQKDFSRPPQMDQALPGGLPRPRNTRFTLINGSDQIIDNLNISPTDDGSWGDDLFGTLALPPNSRVIAGPRQGIGCMFDIRVVYHDHREEVLRRQNLCQTQELTFTGSKAHPRTRAQFGD